MAMKRAVEPFPDVPPEVRRRMAKIVKKDTKPELIVRRLAHRLGYRFRLHRADLPGSPDIVFPSKRKAVFVHGCFWHRHACKLGGSLPSKRQDYWLPKLKRNVERDAQAEADLTRMGWRVLVVWECETRDPNCLAETMDQFLREDKA